MVPYGLGALWCVKKVAVLLAIHGSRAIWQVDR